MEDVFSAIHRRNLWGSAESTSGPGSTLARAADFVPAVVDLLRTLKTSVLLDAPCGEFTWASTLADAVDRYIGVDIVGEVVARNQLIAAGPARSFVRLDLASDALPQSDLILCRDCLVHFAFDDIRRALRNFQQSGARYLLTTTFIEHDNADIATGGWRPLNLQREPFSFPTPLATIDERCVHSDGIYRDKRLALWELPSLKC